jgi:hypothetical protein
MVATSSCWRGIAAAEAKQESSDAELADLRIDADAG